LSAGFGDRRGGSISGKLKKPLAKKRKSENLKTADPNRRGHQKGGDTLKKNWENRKENDAPPSGRKKTEVGGLNAGYGSKK